MEIQRLELRAALMAGKLVVFAAKEMSVPIRNCHAWSDSKIVLRWLHSNEPANNFITDDYVAHIQELTPRSIWKYVLTETNLATWLQGALNCLSWERKMNSGMDQHGCLKTQKSGPFLTLRASNDFCPRTNLQLTFAALYKATLILC